MKIIILSSSEPYATELSRAALLLGHTIVATYISIDDVKKNIKNIEYDYLISSDSLYQNEQLDTLIQFINSIGDIKKLKFILKNPGIHEALLAQYQIMPLYETTPPNTVISILAQEYAINSQFAQQSQYNEQNLQPTYHVPTMNQNTFVHVASASTQQNDPSPTINNSQIYPQGETFLGTPPVQANTPNSPTGTSINTSYNNDQPDTINSNEQIKNMKEESKSILGSRKNNTNFINFKNKFIVVNSPKGGVGKTTLAIELASLISNRAKGMDLNPASKFTSSKEFRTCLIDLNPSFDTMASTLKCVHETKDYPTILNWVNRIEEKIYTSMTNEEKQAFNENRDLFDISPFCNNKIIKFTWDEVKSLTVYDAQTGLYIIPAVALPMDVNKVLPDYISIIIETIRKHFDISIADTSNNLTYFTVEAFHQADEVILVSSPTISTSTVVNRLIDACKKIDVDTSKFNLVINHPNRADSDLEAEKIASVLKINLVAELPYDENLGKILEKGTPFSINTPKSKYSQAVTKLAHQIIPLWTMKKQKIKSKKFFNF